MRILKFLNQYKGYIIHAVAVGVVFLSPAVQAALVAHPAYTAVGGLLWGAILHWANGK